MPHDSSRSLVRTAYAGRRVTAPRRTIASAVVGFQGAFTVDELATRVRHVDSASGATATVYRAVSAMEASGFVARVGERDGHALFARCTAPSHHHHIVCDSCGHVAHTACPLDSTLRSAAESGFVITRHEVTMYGLCPQCTARQGS
ncbi:MAG: transcriptional repressor [Coriobacteriia bacterium]|nr:transcriptional repressor [Coriobacteriia bacterium]